MSLSLHVWLSLVHLMRAEGFLCASVFVTVLGMGAFLLYHSFSIVQACPH
jgi:hypothetical protein